MSASAAPHTFTTLIKNFFVCLLLFLNPHRRFLFLANLIKQRRTQKQTLTAEEISAIAFIVLFVLGTLVLVVMTVVFGLPLLGSGAYNAFRETLWFLVFLPVLLSAMSYCETLPSRVLSPDTTFFLRYSHYAQTPQFADKTKRKQILILEGSKYGSVALDIIFFLIVPAFLIAAFFYNFLTREVSAYSVMLVLSLLFNAIIFMLLVRSVAPMKNRLLYRRYISKHGPMPQEITDIVDKAWELYPDPPKRKKHPKPATARGE